MSPQEAARRQRDYEFRRDQYRAGLVEAGIIPLAAIQPFTDALGARRDKGRAGANGYQAPGGTPSTRAPADPLLEAAKALEPAPDGPRPGFEPT